MENTSFAEITQKLVALAIVTAILLIPMVTQVDSGWSLALRYAYGRLT